MIYNEDAIKWAKEYQGEPFHALFCDPPYHLTSIVKRFGKNGSAPAKFGTDGVFSRSSRGFMGQQWDGGDIAFQPETWEAFKVVMYDGAFGMAFSASRNWHRMAVAIEGLVSLQPNQLIQQADILLFARDTKDWSLVESVEMWIREQASMKDAMLSAGFVIHPTIFGWLNGQGFPKAHRVHKEGQGVFDGHRYGLQALKPAIEPIIVFQKPYSGRPLDNILETGAGVLNIDGSRIATQDEYVINRFDDGAKPFGNGAGHKYTSEKMGRPLRIKTQDKGNENATVFNGRGSGWAVGTTTQGRYPANFIISEENAVYLDEQSGFSKSTSSVRNNRKRHGNDIYGNGKGIPQVSLDSPHDDEGGASRFFFNVSSQVDEADPIYYCSKVSPKERNAGLDELENRPFGMSGGAQGAIARGEDYGNEDSVVPDRVKQVKNPHPTLKPIALCTYLAKLLLPPAEYAPRRIFIPFSGVASEMIGAYKAGWDEVVGVEFDTENNYVDIAEKRLKYWREK